MFIRNEETTDLEAIFRLTASAFASVPHSDGSEPTIIDKLRERGDLTLSRVAVQNEEIVGHIAFSPVRIDSATNSWFGLGPISVAPALQQTGIGSALVRDGLDILKIQGAEGCVLVGDPGYYSRFGFKSEGRLTYEEVPTEYVQWLSFNKTTPTGKVIYSPAFSG